MLGGEERNWVEWLMTGGLRMGRHEDRAVMVVRCFHLRSNNFDDVGVCFYCWRRVFTKREDGNSMVCRSILRQ
jgi:hypothetical protein